MRPKGIQVLMTLIITTCATNIAGAADQDDCRSIQFTEPMDNKVLRNNVIRSDKVLNQDSCQINCYLEPNCVSYNYGPLPDGGFLCELNSRSHVQVPANELQTVAGYIYRTILNACLSSPCLRNSTCQAGFTDKDFRCICPDGYTGDDCGSDVDECSSGSHNCPPNEECINTDGSFNCSCRTGYNAIGLNCTDIDECSDGSHNCNANAICTNIGGSFECSCKPGYAGNGFNCAALAWIHGRNAFSTSLYLLFEKEKNWDDALASCVQIGAQLVKIESQDEVNFIETTFLTSSGRFYWIGLNDKDVEGQWKWSDGTPLTGFKKWIPNNPDNFWGGEDCAATARGYTSFFSYAGHWNDIKCNAVNWYICEQ